MTRSAAHGARSLRVARAIDTSPLPLVIAASPPAAGRAPGKRARILFRRHRQVKALEAAVFALSSALSPRLVVTLLLASLLRLENRLRFD
jgi:hypothetical protein